MSLGWAVRVPGRSFVDSKRTAYAMCSTQSHMSGHRGVLSVVYGVVGTPPLTPTLQDQLPDEAAKRVTWVFNDVCTEVGLVAGMPRLFKSHCVHPASQSTPRLDHKTTLHLHPPQHGSCLSVPEPCMGSECVHQSRMHFSWHVTCRARQEHCALWVAEHRRHERCVLLQPILNVHFAWGL